MELRRSIEKRAESIMLCLNNVCNTGYTLQECDYDFIEKQIDEIKKEIADVQPIKRGKWLKRMSTSDSRKCSVCGNSHEYPTTYCPNCGARMDGD